MPSIARYLNMITKHTNVTPLLLMPVIAPRRPDRRHAFQQPNSGHPLMLSRRQTLKVIATIRKIHGWLRQRQAKAMERLPSKDGLLP